MELKKGETIMIDAALHLPVSFLHEAFSDRSGVPLALFELYYRGKRLEGEAAHLSWGVEKDSTIEVKMRGRGGMPRLGNSPSDHRSGLQSSRPEGGAGAEATLALETAAAASAASSTGAQEGAGILRSALSRTPLMMTWGKSHSGERALLSAAVSAPAALSPEAADSGAAAVSSTPEANINPNPNLNR